MIGKYSFTDIVRGILIAYVIFFILYPLAYFTVFVLSPRSINEIFSFLSSDLFRISLNNSIYVTIITTIFTTIVGVPYAYFLHRYRIPG
ncbi:MAG: hypothetical protein ACP5IE_08130, partial [Infirmifilum sp.]